MRGWKLSLLSLLLVACRAQAADWPCFRADAARSGYSAESLPQTLKLRWVHRSAQPPSPAWPTRSRLAFDRAFQPIVAQGIVYYGSSTDDQVVALNASTGEVLWTFFTGAPVRFAPVAWDGRLYVASDDGHLYCLAAKTGRLLWKRRGGPRADMLLGNERLISRWPARGGPVVGNGLVYFGAGIWPSEGIYLYALEPRSGEIVWQNDTSGSIEMDQPHSTARAESGISAQGYLALARSALLVPTGRAVPAVLEPTSGKLRFYQLQANQHVGGSDVMAVDEHFLNAGAVYATGSGVRVGQIGLQAVAHPDLLIYAQDDRLVGLPRNSLTTQKVVTNRKGVPTTVTQLSAPAWEMEIAFDAEPTPSLPMELRPPDVRMNSTAWSTPSSAGQAAALIAAAQQVVVGGAGRVSVASISTHQLDWSAQVEGTACGLAAADGCLYVSTDHGCLYCFGAASAEVVEREAASGQSPLPLADSSTREPIARLLGRFGFGDGICIVLGCGSGDVPLELARQSEMRVYVVDPDPVQVQQLRERCVVAGLYGSRLTAHVFDLSRVPYADWCADLVVLNQGAQESPSDACYFAAQRLQRPCGGVLCRGPAGNWNVSVRGAEPGTADWTHQNTSPANTLCSHDQQVRGTLEMLWFRDTDLLMANRHGRAPAALVQDGRMFVEGLNGLRAQSIYNGRVFWECSLPGILSSYHREHSIGAAWTGGNVCLGPGRVFVHDGQACRVLATENGRQLGHWEPPRRGDGKPGKWGYIAYDDGLLYGSLANEDYLVKCWSDRWDTGEQFTESLLLFALDATTGRLVWSYRPEHSIRHNAVAIGGGRVHLIDRRVAPQDDINYVDQQRRGEAAEGGSQQVDPPLHVPGRLVTLDARTGKLIWQVDREIFGTLLMYSAQEDLVWMGYQAAHQASRDSERGDRMAVFRAGTGERIWDATAQYVDRPVLCGRTVFAPPGAYDLLTGAQLPFQLERSYGCGTIAGCAQMLIFRSATLGYVDLASSPETRNYGGIRPGCWIAAIPAGGVVVMPDAASWCTCSYQNQCTMALKPERNPYTTDSAGSGGIGTDLAPAGTK